MYEKKIYTGPEIQKGFNLVEGEPRFQPLLQGVEHAVWIDSGNQASTYELSAVEKTLLDRVEIGRAFTPLQHFQLVSNLEKFITEGTEVLVLPSIDLLYAEGQMGDKDAEATFQEMISRLSSTVEKHGLKVLISTESDLGFHVLEHVENRIEMKSNRHGTRFSSESYETTIYREGLLYQTTIAYYLERNREGPRATYKPLIRD